MTYTINYQTGITEEIEGTLEQAKAMADEGAAYTQQDITILDEKGETVACRSWWGVAYDPDETDETEDEVIQFGSFGHYSAWREN